MFRHFGLFALCSLFIVASVAQTPTDSPTTSALDNSTPPYRNSGNTRHGKAGAQISITRLKEPRKARHLFERAMRAWLKSAPVEAEARLDEALKIDPAFPEALSLYGGIQASLGQWESAEQNLQRAIQVDPSYSPAYVVLAGVYNAQKRFDEAQEATQKAISEGASNWDVQYEIARAFIGKRQYDSALAVTEAALREKNHGSLLHLAKAHALLGLRRYSQATAELRAYLRDQPSGDGSQEARVLLQQVESWGSP